MCSLEWAGIETELTPAWSVGRMSLLELETTMTSYGKPYHPTREVKISHHLALTQSITGKVVTDQITSVTVSFSILYEIETVIFATC